MTQLRTNHVLQWHTRLCEGGYTCFELQDAPWGVRWGYVINAAAHGWVAHVGDFGQANSIGEQPPPLEDHLRHFETVTSAKAWVEEEVAAAWRTPRVVQGPQRLPEDQWGE